MKKLLFLFSGLLLFSFRPVNSMQVIDPQGLKIKVYDFENFRNLYTHPDTTYVINFWATWCKPCVAELPEFQKLFDSTRGQAVKIILANLDMKKNWEPGLVNFLKKQNLRPEVVVLYETDANQWIPKVDENWSGAIPATLITKAGINRFHEGTTTFKELIETIQKL